MLPNVIASVGATPNNIVAINRVRINAPTNPSATPISASFIPLPMIILNTTSGRAPRASGGIRVGILFLKVGADVVHVSVCLFESHSRLQARHTVKTRMITAALPAGLV